MKKLTTIWILLLSAGWIYCQSWILQESGTTSGLYSNSFFDENYGITVGEGGTILKTSDSGNTWTKKTSGISSALYGAAYFNSNTLLVTGDAGVILRSTNSGENWSRLSTGFSNDFYFIRFIGGTSGIAVGNSGKIIKTTDNGDSWVSQNSYVSSNLYSADFFDNNNGIVVGYNGTILRTTTGGNTWFGQNSGTTKNLLGVSFLNSTTVIVTGEGGTILRSTDGGQSWANISSGTSKWLRGVDFSNSQKGYIIGQDGTILNTTNGGQNWTSVQSPTILSLVGLSSINDNSYTATGISGRIIQLKNVSISLIYPNGGENLKIGNVIPIRWNAINVPFVKIEYSTNGGTEWIQIATNLIGSQGLYNWQVQNTPSTNCKIRISYTNVSSVYDVSDNIFSISVDGIKYSVTGTSVPSNGGTISGTGQYDSGQTVNLIAMPSVGYGFLNWTENGIVVATNSTFSFNIQNNRNLIANFAPIYTITTINNPTDGGTTNGGGNFISGSLVTVNAIANIGFIFVNWTENGVVVSNNSSYQFNLSGNRILVANYSPAQFVINLSSNIFEGGTLLGAGTYPANKSIVVNAISNPGYAFLNWTENGSIVSTDKDYSFTLTTNRNLIANFIKQYLVETIANPISGGIVSGSGAYNMGAQVSINAIANQGYSFINWSEGTDSVTSSSNHIFTITNNRKFTANFKPHVYDVVAVIQPTGSGIVTGDGKYTFGSNVKLKAIPNSGYNFTHWSENGSILSTNSEISFTISANRNLVANFSSQLCTITLSNEPSNGGVTTGSGTFIYGQNITINAVPNTGFGFKYWSENNSLVSRQRDYAFKVLSSRTITAKFGKLFLINLESSILVGGIVSGGGEYVEGDTIKINATANNGYAFLNWTENGVIVSEKPLFSLVVSNNRKLVANFIQQFSVSILMNPNDGGITIGSGKYNKGSSVTIKAIPNTNYGFKNWVLDNYIISTNDEYTFKVNQDLIFIANFLEKYSLTILCSPSVGGTTTGSGIYFRDSKVTITAAPSTGYKFIEWTDGNSVISSTQNSEIVVSSNKTVTAHFSLIPKLVVNPLSLTVPCEEGSASVDISNANGGAMKWGASSNAPWLIITSGLTGSKDGKVNFTYLKNSGDARSTKIIVSSLEALNSPIEVEIKQDKFTSVENISGLIPTKFELKQNFPNPFNPETKIQFSIPRESYVLLRVYDILGNEVETLVNLYLLPAVYNVHFNARKLNNGIYFYKLESNEYTKTRKMIYLK